MSAVTIAMIDRRINKSADVLKLKEPIDKTIVVDAKTSLKAALQQVKTWTGNRKITVLKILAHGVVVTDPNTRAQMYLIDFCKDGISAATAPMFSVLKGRFRSTTLPGIELIACGATDSGVTAQSKVTISQGISLCQGVANGAGTVVKASPDVQNVGERTTRASPDPRVMTKKVVINPGPWEGRIWYFRPGRRAPYVRSANTYKPVRVR